MAGTIAAFHLSAYNRVLLLDSGSVGSGATGVGAGIASPILARKGNPTYRSREALDSLEQLCDVLSLPEQSSRPLIRPAFDTKQISYYQRAASNHPDLAKWIEPGDLSERFPSVRAPLGALEVFRGRVINLPTFATALTRNATTSGCELREHTSLTSWSAKGDEVVVTIRTSNGKKESNTQDESIACRRLVLALGAGYRHFEELARLNLHPIKGQTIRASCPSILRKTPNITGPGYLAFDGDSLVLGSTFTHGVFDTEPTASATQQILDLVVPIVPDVAHATSFEATAGTRVTVPGTRLPMIGPISHSSLVNIFTGLGAKGLLMGSLIGSELDRYLRDPENIPEIMRPSVRRPASG